MKLVARAALLAVLSFCTTTPAHAAPGQDGPVVMLPAVEVVQALPIAPAGTDFATLTAAVDAQIAPVALDSELNCLAIGIYYESKGEPLAGQLAVAEVILNRTTSGRFPSSVCSVITQPSQFSFVRGGVLPAAPDNAQWRKALAVAQVARKDLWASPVGQALFFHARYVNPGWKRPRVGTIGNHIFYR